MKTKLFFLFCLLSQIGVSQTAKIQFIHNAPDTSVNQVDVFVDGNLIVDDLTFKTGTSFLDVPFVGGQAQITITNATDPTEILVERLQDLVDVENYYLVVDGIHDTASYVDIEPFDFYMYQGAQLESIYAGQGFDVVDIAFHQGALGLNFSLDAGGYGVLACGELLMAVDIVYSEFGDNYIHAPSNEDFYINVRDHATGGSSFSFGSILPMFSEDLQLNEKAMLLMLTGFLDPEVNNSLEGLSVTYITPEGGEFQNATLGLSEEALSEIVMYPNPTSGMITVSTTIDGFVGNLYNTNGKVVRKNLQLNDNGSSALILDDLIAGIYFLELTNQTTNRTLVKRIVKK